MGYSVIALLTLLPIYLVALVFFQANSNQARCMISMATIGSLKEHHHSLGLYCLPCDRWGEANLNRLIETGKGDRPIVETGFRCRDCGVIVEKQIRAPVPTIGGAVSYVSPI